MKYEPRVPLIGKEEEWVQKEGHLKGGDVEEAVGHRQTPALQRWDFPDSRVVETHAFSALGPSSVPGWYILQAAWYGLKKKKKKTPTLEKWIVLC